MDLRYINTFHTIVEAGALIKQRKNYAIRSQRLRFMLVSWRKSLACSFLKRLAGIWF